MQKTPKLRVKLFLEVAKIRQYLAFATKGIQFFNGVTKTRFLSLTEVI